MKTIEIKLYSFNELNEEAKETAHNNWLSQGSEYFWGDEAINTLKKFADIFNINIRDYSLSSYRCDINFTINQEDDVLNLSGSRLIAYLWNNYKNDIYKGKYYTVNTEIKNYHRRIKTNKLSNGKIFYAYRSAINLDNCCPLTGVCFDDDILKPIFDFMEKPNDNTFEDVLTDCIQNFETVIQKDIEYSESIEYFAEHAEANDYEFTEEGERY